MTVRLAAAAMAVWLAAAGAMAGGIEPVDFDDAQQRERYDDLIDTLRCLVCQNQTLAESNAELARDMRAVIRTKIRSGDSDQSIVSFMTDRYGDFVLYRPPLKGSTFLLWLGPLLAALAALAAAPLVVRRQRSVKLSERQRQESARILEEK